MQRYSYLLLCFLLYGCGPEPVQEPWELHDFSGGHLYTALPARDSSLWFSGLSEMYRISYGTTTYFNESNTTVSPIGGYSPIIEDSLGRILAMNTKGIIVFDNGKWSQKILSPLSGQDPIIPSSLVASSDGTLWGMRDHQLYKISPSSWSIEEEIPIPTSGPYTQLTNLAIDKGGTLYFGSKGEGLFRYSSTAGFQHITTALNNDLISDTVAVLMIDGSNHLWVSTQDAVQAIELGSFQVDGTKTEQFQAGLIRDIAFDKDNHIWLAADSGLYRIDAHQWKKQVTPYAEFNHNVTRLFFDKGNALWILSDAATQALTMRE